MNADSKQSKSIKGKEKLLTDSCVGIDREGNHKRGSAVSYYHGNHDLRADGTANIEKGSIAAWHRAVQRNV